MKKEPCIRFGMRISPKISEKPADSRNSRPPSAMLFTARVSQRLIAAYVRDPILCAASLLQILRQREVSRIDRVRQKRLLVVSPELAHIGIGLDHGVDEAAVFLLATADEHGPHHVAEMIELDRTARRVGQRDLMQGLRQRLAVVGLA